MTAGGQLRHGPGGHADRPVLFWPGAGLEAVRDEAMRLGWSVLPLTPPFEQAPCHGVRSLVLGALVDAVVPILTPTFEADGGLRRDRVLSLVDEIGLASPPQGRCLNALVDRCAHGAGDGPMGAAQSILQDFAEPDVLRACLALVQGLRRARTMVLLIDVPAGLPSDVAERLEDTVISLSASCPARLWLVAPDGGGFTRIDRARLNTEPPGLRPPDPIRFPPLSGQPKATSRVEQALEAALARRAWAMDRHWNRSVHLGGHENPINVDLMWEDARLIVECDGPDHLQPDKYAADRRRDRALQARGYRVLRFPNDEIVEDTERVCTEIESFLTQALSERGQSGPMEPALTEKNGS